LERHTKYQLLNMEIKQFIENLTTSEGELDEKLIVDAISQRVADMMETNMELLLSYLYRLDIEESKINHALDMGTLTPPHIGIANLIWERQKQRMETKKKYKQDPIEGWEF